MSDDDERIPSGARLALTGNAQQRALAAWHLGWPDARAALGGDAERASRTLLGHLLDDPYPAVRYIAERALRASGSAGPLDYDFLAPAPIREAARARMLAEGSFGDLDQATFDRLARLRDDQEMDLRE